MSGRRAQFLRSAVIKYKRNEIKNVTKEKAPVNIGGNLQIFQKMAKPKTAQDMRGSFSRKLKKGPENDYSALESSSE